MSGIVDVGGAGALLSVVVIDVVLAGDNAIVVGLAAAGLPAAQRTKVILIGIAAATILRIALAFLAKFLLAVIGLTLAGGVLLLWVAWKLYRELGTSDVGHDVRAKSIRPKKFSRSVWQVVAADVSMSLDNVLAVAGTARDHPWVLVLGLILSVALMGFASDLIARLLARHRWIGWVGLAIVAYVAVYMIYDGSAEVIHSVLSSRRN